MELKDRFSQYRPTPEPEVWEGIRRTMIRRKALRYGGIALGVVAVAVTAVLLLNRDNAPIATQTVANTDEAVQTAATLIEETNAVSVAESVTAKPAAVANTEAAVRTENPAPASIAVKAPVATENRGAEATTPAVQTPVAAPVQKNISKQTAAPVAAPAATPVQVAQTSEEIPAELGQEQPSVFTAGSPVQDSIVWIPNVFSPKSDVPENRVFKVIAHFPIKHYSIYIYNRGGRQVFHSTDVREAWDGTYKGSALPQGAYVYVLNYIDTEDQSHTDRGTVLLIR